MPTLLLVTNVGLDDPGGRAANLASRTERLADRGWDTVVGRVPEPYGRSFVPSVLRCARMARRHDVDLVTAVSNPFHLQLVGFAASRLSGAPWLAEFRDPMVTNPDRDPDALVTRVAGLVESFVVRHAEGVVWGDGIQLPDDYLAETYPEVPAARTRKLPYKGFDPDTFASASTREFDRFTVVYAGSFYDGWIEPYTFLEGLARFTDRTEDTPRALFYGDWRQAYDEVVADRGLADVVDHHEFVPKTDLLPTLKGADALLYIGGSDPENRLNVPSKIYDYIGAKRPILAVGDPSFRAQRLVEENDLGRVAPYEDPAAIADALELLSSGDTGYDPAAAFLAKFHRSNKIDALEEVYDRVAAGGLPGAAPDGDAGR